MIGHKNHPEVEGTLGRFPSESSGKIYLVEDENDAKSVNISQPSNLALVTQTTLSVDDTEQIINILKKRFPKIKSPNADDICYATQNRQDAVKQLALETDFIIVVGSENSSNSNRLKELAELMGTKSCLVDHVSQLSEKSLKSSTKLGITSGASAPEELVREIISYCKSYGFSVVEEIEGLKENISFKLPKELR
jgi:4-hydroxy-3-methylbut-2-enyl diphosphate reductase